MGIQTVNTRQINKRPGKLRNSPLLAFGMFISPSLTPDPQSIIPSPAIFPIQIRGSRCDFSEFQPTSSRRCCAAS